MDYAFHPGYRGQSWPLRSSSFGQDPFTLGRATKYLHRNLSRVLFFSFHSLQVFRFKTRLQQLNQLEASSRAKINFLDKLYRFHKQQGNPNATIPSIDNRPLDMWLLNREITRRGGPSQVTNRKEWGQVAKTLGYAQPHAPHLKSAYARVIQPFDEFYAHVKGSPRSQMRSDGDGALNSAQIPPTPRTPTPAMSRERTRTSEETSGKPFNLAPQRASSVNDKADSTSRASSDSSKVSEHPPTSDSTSSSALVLPELHRLDSSELKTADTIMKDGGGPKLSLKRKRQRQMGSETATTTTQESEAPATPPPKRLTLRLQKPQSQQSQSQPQPPPAPPSQTGSSKTAAFVKGDACEICRNGRDGKKILLCDDCDRGFHIYCLDPPLSKVPTHEEWYCPECLLGTGNDFGFDEGEEHSLHSFAARAHAFKKDWFEKHPLAGNTVTEHDVEEEFWRLAESQEEVVEVEYGADIHSTTHGSAAPTLETHPFAAASLSGWNLNNLPIWPKSLLRYIKSDISGMTVPWIYIGMLFSTFCWHNEDHFTYSVNYMYWGETKTWYGIPASDAEKFEQAISSEAPELFEQQPDLMFGLVTMMNPGRVKAAGVDVFACDQRPGEFVITFPKAYHCGFNQGLNFNEAVNFALPNWLPFGAESVQRYREFGKAPVFSHEELLVSISQHNKTIETAIWLHPELSAMVEREIHNRNSVDFLNILSANDLETICSHCKYFCHLSVVTCEYCSHVGCIDHWKQMCNHPPSTRRLRIRYSNQQLIDMQATVAQRAAIPVNWRLRLQTLLDGASRPEFKDIRALVVEGEKINYPLPDLLALRPFVAQVNSWVERASVFFERPMVSRKRGGKKDRKIVGELDEDSEEERRRAKRKPETIVSLLKAAAKLSFDCPELNQLRQLYNQIKDFAEKARELLQKPDVKIKEVEQMVILGRSYNVDLPVLRELTRRYNQCQWMQEMDQLDEAFLELDDIEAWIERGLAAGIPEDNVYFQMLVVRQKNGHAWKKRVEEILRWSSVEDRFGTDRHNEDGPHFPLSELESLVAPCLDRPIVGETLSLLSALRNRALSVQHQAQLVLSDPKRHTIQQATKVEDLNNAKARFVWIPEVERLRNELKSYDGWKRKALVYWGRASQPTDQFDIRDPETGQSDLTDSFLKIRLQRLLDHANQLLDPDDDFPQPREPRNTGTLHPEHIPYPRFNCVCRRGLTESADRKAGLQCSICLEMYHDSCLRDERVFDRDPTRETKQWRCIYCRPTRANGHDFSCLHNATAETLLLIAQLEPETSYYIEEFDMAQALAKRLKRVGALLIPRLQSPTVDDYDFLRHWLRKFKTFEIDIRLGHDKAETADLPTEQPYLEDLLIGRFLEVRKLVLAPRPKKTVPSCETLRERNQWPRFQFDGGCVCNSPPSEAFLRVRCRICEESYHVECVWAPQDALGRDGVAWDCPKCMVADGVAYPYADARAQHRDHLGTCIYIDTAATLVSGKQLVTRLEAPPALNSRHLDLVVNEFIPGDPARPGSLLATYRPPRPETPPPASELPLAPTLCPTPTPTGPPESSRSSSRTSVPGNSNRTTTMVQQDQLNEYVRRQKEQNLLDQKLAKEREEQERKRRESQQEWQPSKPIPPVFHNHKAWVHPDEDPAELKPVVGDPNDFLSGLIKVKGGEGTDEKTDGELRDNPNQPSFQRPERLSYASTATSSSFPVTVSHTPMDGSSKFIPPTWGMGNGHPSAVPPPGFWGGGSQNMNHLHPHPHPHPHPHSNNAPIGFFRGAVPPNAPMISVTGPEIPLKDITFEDHIRHADDQRRRERHGPQRPPDNSYDSALGPPPPAPPLPLPVHPLPPYLTLGSPDPSREWMKSTYPKGMNIPPFRGQGN